MEKIAVVTDSTSDLTLDMAEEYGVFSLPLQVVYKAKSYRDRIDITPDEVYARLTEEVPTTSMPSPHEILELFESLKKQGFTHAICLHISSGLSGTCDVVRSMARQVQGLVIEVVDSKSLSMGLGLQVMEVARNVSNALPFKTIVEKAIAAVPTSKVFFVLKTLEYLRKGGRIGYVKGSIGELLQIKPIISINHEGKYYNVDQTRGRVKSLDKLYELVKETVEHRKSIIAVCHGGAETEAKALLERLSALANVRKVFFTQISPVMVVHTGPGLVGVTILPE